ncbi:MAG: protein translocase subunit SecD, partial [Paracraurococcus sp.]
MMYFARWKTLSILAVCLLGALLCLPNFFPKSELPSWARQFSLGLDLRGGSYLLLEVDLDAVVRERLESLIDGARSKLRPTRQPQQTGASEAIGYTNLAANPAKHQISLRATDSRQLQEAVTRIRELANEIPTGLGTSTPDIEVASAPDGTVTATLTEAGLRAKASGAVEQSLEIVRRRIDETGVAEALIARQGQNRILVQLPGVEDPNRIKELLGKTARMTFHLLDEGANPSAATPPIGARFMTGESRNGQIERYVVRNKVEVDGANLTDARAGQDGRTGEWEVNF